jgi:hypothetical protein
VPKLTDGAVPWLVPKAADGGLLRPVPKPLVDV